MFDEKLKKLKLNKFVAAVRESYDASVAFAEAKEIGCQTPETKASYWDNFRRKQAAEEILERILKENNYDGTLVDIEMAKYMKELNNPDKQQ
jgi:hypothetical protein